MTSAGADTLVVTCVVLVDYDNAFPPSAGFSDEEVAHAFEGWLRQLAGHFPDAEHFEVRLYGGWYDDANLSRHGSEVARILTLLPEFPRRLAGDRILRGNISLAVSPLSSLGGTPLLGTYRRRGSLPRVRLSKHPYPDACAQVDAQCPAAILKSFTKHSRRECPVDHCSLVASDAFVVHEQKMVDTMLATDVLLTGTLFPENAAVVVVSGDSDFVPPLLAAKIVGRVRLVQLRPREDEASTYATAVLTDAGIEVF
jgi:NYN domain